MLDLKPDAEEAFRHIEAWWNGELIDRVCIAVYAQKDNHTPREVPKPPTIEEQWTNIDYVIESRAAEIESIAFLGDAIPKLRASLGPSFITAALGCPLHFMPTTTWTEPIIEDWDTFADFSDYRENRWYKLSVEMMERVTEAAQGRFIAQMPDLHPGGDGVASMRGNEKFLLDLYDKPDRVRWAMEHLDDMFCEMVDTYYRISTSRGQYGSMGFLTWGPGKTFPIQDDTLALVSPQMAKDMLLPSILRQARHVDHALFHLDGPEATDKLDMLLDAPEIHGIQWQPGAAHREMTQWIPLMKRILGAGKLLLAGCKATEVEPILSEVPAKGLRLVVNAQDEDEGRDILRRAARLSK